MLRSRWSWISFVSFVVLSGLSPRARALEREYVLRWLPPSGTVDGYRAYLAPQGLSTQALDLGAVAPDPDGIARATLQLDAAITYGVSMTAYNAAGESPRSNQITVAASACDPAACSDGDPCTADDCQTSSCTHTRLPDGSVCGSGSVCIAGACRVPQCTSNADCDDADLCDGRETCAGFQCASGSPLTCAAPGPCQQGGCRADSGCWLASLPDGSACSDGNPDTTGDQCIAGRCAGTVPSGCRSNAECSDGNLCNGSETCALDGSCQPGTPLVCGGSTQCADAMCSPQSGCVMTPRPDGTACSDGLASTTGDQCIAGQCRGTASTPAALSLASVSPTVLREARYYQLRLLGTGFVSGMKASFRSPSMARPPVVLRTRVRDAQTADVLIWTRWRKQAETWDVVVTLPDGRTTALPAAVRTDP
jgi:hypothetical protein